MWYRSKERSNIRFDRGIKPTSEIWIWLWVALGFYALLLTDYGFLTFDNNIYPKNNRFYHFVVIPGYCLFIVQMVVDRFAKFNHLTSLELASSHTLLWSTRWKNQKIPLQNIRKLTLYTRELSPEWAKNGIVRHSGSLQYSGGVIYLDKLTIPEFQRLERLFEIIINTNPEIRLVRDLTPYDPANEVGQFGGT